MFEKDPQDRGFNLKRPHDGPTSRLRTPGEPPPGKDNYMIGHLCDICTKYYDSRRWHRWVAGHWPIYGLLSH